MKRLFLLLGACLTGCGPKVVTALPTPCSTLIPSSWSTPVPGADLPTDQAIGSWVSFAVQQTARLEEANGRTADTLGIVSRCEARDRAAVQSATRRHLF